MARDLCLPTTMTAIASRASSVTYETAVNLNCQLLEAARSLTFLIVRLSVEFTEVRLSHTVSIDT